ncbi:MAG: hypothetical protein HZB26_26260 [Candidatus Hydrogenedentes bacterium]|nr:hypothetical protein [Candidatus Hydrogenedentota bacterium]
MSIGAVSSLTSVYASSVSLQLSATSLSQTDPSKLSDRLASRFLKKNDTNGSGGLSGSEVVLSKDAFSEIDSNGDGQLSPDEIKAAVQKQLDALKSAFESGGAAGVQSLLESSKGKPQGEILNALFPQLANGPAGPTGVTGYRGHQHKFDAERIADKAAAKFIKKNDADSDGNLSNSEVSGLSEDDFTTLDTNSDGKLSQDEIKGTVQKSLEGLHEAFQTGGKSGAQNYLNSLKNTPEGALLKTVLPNLFGPSPSGAHGGSSAFSLLIQQTQVTITSTTVSLSGLNVNTTV